MFCIGLHGAIAGMSQPSSCSCLSVQSGGRQKPDNGGRVYSVILRT
jgi:hypothetical protein